ncbi:nuclear transport factor 2 family protein [Kitasatospora sp. NPDC050543]|uniref:nuclear transport factor 2 family protein n=1 Tax=Kitasatospora sp. NPDC050543 TaxID=3364054 RepID=UPI0037AC6B69
MGADDTRELGIRLYDRWTALWNHDLDLAVPIMAPEFTLRYAQAGAEVFDDARTPPQLADIIAAWHKGRPGLTFTAEGVAVVDLTLVDGVPSGLVARPYRASFTGEDGDVVERSGTDILRVADGLIAEVWSVSSGVGGRTFYR